MTIVHYMSMVVMGVGSFIFGMLPIVFSTLCRRSCPLFLSLILCLGAGVLLATSLVHMLTEVQIKLKWTAQLYFCGGFLILYTIDEITHYCIGVKKPKHFVPAQNYGATHHNNHASESSVLLKPNNDITNYQNLCDTDHDKCQKPQLRLRHAEDSSSSSSEQSLMGISSHFNNCTISPYNKLHIPISPQDVDISEPYSSSPVAKTGLLVALLIHSILEGITIGVQTETSQVLLILGAVTFHKVVLSFCLGLELNSDGYKLLSLVSAILLFSLGNPIGIFIGMSVTSPVGQHLNIDHQLQAIAAGSLFYVAAFEVLPRERYKWRNSSDKKTAGIFQLIFLLVGFLSITILHLTIVHDEPTGSGNATTLFSHNVTYKPDV